MFFKSNPAAFMRPGGTDGQLHRFTGQNSEYHLKHINANERQSSPKPCASVQDQNCLDYLNVLLSVSQRIAVAVVKTPIKNSSSFLICLIIF